MSAPPVPADALLTGFTLLSGVRGTPALRDAALAISGDRIAWTGPAADAPPARQRIALPGRVITPGFVNVHTHSALVMVRGVASDLGFAPSYTKGVPNALDLEPGEASALALLGAVEAMLAGSTLLGEHFVHLDACLPSLAALGIRIHASHRLHDVDFRRVAAGEWVFDPAIGDALLAANVDLHARWHGREDGRIAVQFAAHAADTCSEPYLRQIAREARARDAVLNTHLAQSAVEIERVQARCGRSPVAVFEDAGLLDRRFLGGHGIFLDQDDMSRLSKAGAHVVHIPKANAASGRMAPTPRLRAAGINLALATDTQHGDMVELLRWTLATARLQTGRVDGDWQPTDALEMATLGGARALGLDADLGTLEPGKKADLVVFDFRRPHLVPVVDPLGTLCHTAQGRDVEQVWVDGRCVVRDGRPTQVDVDAVVREAQEAAQRLWARVLRH